MSAPEIMKMATAKIEELRAERDTAQIACRDLLATLRECQRQAAIVPELVAALRGIVLVCGETGDFFEDFESQAEAFRRETGWMRPGKDMASASGGEDDHEKRRAKYNEWVDAKIATARAAIAKAEKKDPAT